MDMIQIVLVGSLTILTFWRKDILLYLIVSPLLIGMGLAWYDSYHTSFGMITSIGLMLLGAYSFALGIINMLKSE